MGFHFSNPANLRSVPGPLLERLWPSPDCASAGDRTCAELGYLGFPLGLVRFEQRSHRMVLLFLCGTPLPMDASERAVLTAKAQHNQEAISTQGGSKRARGEFYATAMSLMSLMVRWTRATCLALCSRRSAATRTRAAQQHHGALPPVHPRPRRPPCAGTPLPALGIKQQIRRHGQ